VTPWARVAIAAQIGWAGLAAGLALLLGCLTSLGQTVLPEAVQPLANSASGWTLLTIGVLWWLRTWTWVSAVLGAVCFVLLNVGYALVAGARGFFYSPVLWSVVGIVVGPFVGLAVAWARQRMVSRTAALGFGFLAGLLLGDAVSGFVRVRDTTGWFYWAALGVGALVWVAVVAVRRFSETRDRLLLAGLTVFTAVALVVGLEVLQALLS
jgi:hypothetical protein